MKQRDLEKIDKRYIWHPFTSFDEWESEQIISIDHAKGNYLYSSDGKKYFDANSSLWCNLFGHRNREIDSAIKSQIDNISHSTFLGTTHPPAVKLTEKLIKLMPDDRYRVFYSDSGSESIEVALKICYQYFHLKEKNCKKDTFISFKNGYHGDTLGAVSSGGIDTFHKVYKKLTFKTIQVDSPYFYRCGKGARTHEECGDHCINELEEVLRRFSHRVCGILIEPLIQCAAGMITQPKGFLSNISKLSKKFDVPLIVDEVATGFMRSGTMFAYQQEKIRPDILILGKGITGGYLPLSCAVIDRKFSDLFRGSHERTFFHGHTYTANQLACRSAIAALELLDNKNLCSSVSELIQSIKSASALISSGDHVGDIRQTGLICGIEIVMDRVNKKPFPMDKRIGRKICLKLRDHGILTRPLGDVVVFFPSLITKKTQVEMFFRALRQVIGTEVC